MKLKIFAITAVVVLSQVAFADNFRVPFGIGEKTSQTDKASPVTLLDEKSIQTERVYEVVVPTRRPSSVSAPVHGYTVQLSSYATPDEAQKLFESLKAKNLDVFQMEGMVNGIKRYRVCVGHYKSRKEALTEVPKWAKETGHVTAFVQKLGQKPSEKREVSSETK